MIEPHSLLQKSSLCIALFILVEKKRLLEENANLNSLSAQTLNFQPSFRFNEEQLSKGRLRFIWTKNQSINPPPLHSRVLTEVFDKK